MDLTREYIDSLSFTVKKGKYYLGSEVDESLDAIAEGVEELQKKLAEFKLREEKMAKVLIRYQNAEKQKQQEDQARIDEHAQLEAARVQLEQQKALIQQLRDTAAASKSGESSPAEDFLVVPPVVAPTLDPEQLRMAAQAERTLAEYKATRENLIAELTALQTRRDSMQREITAIANAAANRILALTKN